MGTNVQEQRDFLKKFIEKMVIRNDKIEVVYYTPGATSAFSKIPSLQGHHR